MLINQIVSVVILIVVIWSFINYRNQVDESFKDAYRKKYGHEPSESEVKRNHDNHFDIHGQV